MKNRQRLFWSDQIDSWGLNSRYFFVVAIFILFIFYSGVVATKESSKRLVSAPSQPVDQVVWDVTTENTEKVFRGVLQGRPGDWYRMSISTKANREARVETILRSVFSEDVSLGSFEVVPSDDFRFHEIIFSVPAGRFSDLKFVLHEKGMTETWSHTGIKFSEFALSRLNVKNRFEANKLVPTVAGSIVRDTEVFITDKDILDSRVILESRFVAQSDFIENIILHLNEKLKNESYTLELYAREKNGDVLIKKNYLEPGKLDTHWDEWGNKKIFFPVRLERGMEYRIILRGSESASRNISVLPLEGLQNEEFRGESNLAVTFGRYTHVENDILLSGAKVEDFGKEFLYSYSLSGEIDDFFDLFDTHGGVRFDTKEKLITGSQKQQTSFTYRFFTVYPFQKFVLGARQAGGSGIEVKLEYSFDNTSWQEVLPEQINGSWVFSFVLTGTDRQRVVYVRTSYNGEDKKAGSFGLDQLSVLAELTRK